MIVSETVAALGLYRVAVGGRVGLARGPAEGGPQELLDERLRIDDLLAEGGEALAAALAGDSAGPVPADVTILAPVETQEVWAAGVTYRRSLQGRMEESREPTVYDRVYDAARPELFFKAPGWRVRGPGQSIAIRADSEWNVPEPELALVLTAQGQIVGYTIGNDVSSRSIEGENPLYLPQAKVYDGACAVGPCIVPVGVDAPVSGIRLVVERAGAVVLKTETSTGELHRTLEDLAAYLFRALTFPVGAVLLTGTGLVPDASFSLQAGDLVAITIQGMGTLSNRVETVGTAE